MELKYIHTSELFGSPPSEERMAKLSLELSRLPSLRARVLEVGRQKNSEKRAESLAGLYLLSRMSELPSGELKSEPGGRPYFSVASSASGAQNFDFNISHSASFAVCVADTKRVGVDVERLRPIADRDRLAQRYFCPAEREYVKSREDGDEAFLRVWTRKEALLKFTGDGLTQDLRSIDTVACAEIFDERTVLQNGEKYLICICKKKEG